jgi:hypothetical protein
LTTEVAIAKPSVTAPAHQCETVGIPRLVRGGDFRRVGVAINAVPGEAPKDGCGCVVDGDGDARGDDRDVGMVVVTSAALERTW